MSTITVTEIDLTEDLARELLGRNLKNRPVKRGAIVRYVDDIVMHRWHFTAEPIKLDAAGNLLDGQNRCLAVIAANEKLREQAEASGELYIPVSIRVLLVRGLDSAAQDVMDTGKTRSVGDQLAIRGVSSYSMMAAAVRTILVLLSSTDRVGRPAHPSHAEMLEFYDAYKQELDDIKESTPDYGNTSGINGSVLIAARFLLQQTCDDTEAIESFFKPIWTGADLSEGNPILALRTRMQQAKLNREVIVNPVAATVVLRAWNAWRKGETLYKIPLRTRQKAAQMGRIEP